MPNNKYTSFIASAAVIIIPLLLFFAMCLPLNHSEAEVNEGTLDLSTENIKGRIFALNGDWKMVYGELLMPGDFPETAPTIPVPADWSSQDFPPLGAATYRFTVSVTDTGVPYMLMINSVSSAYALWVNSELLHTEGIPAVNAERTVSQHSNALVPLFAENGTIDIVIHVSNYEFYSGGITGTVFFGEADAIQKYFIRTRMMYALSLGCILLAAFYHLLLYLFRRQEKAYILFSLMCFLCFVRFLVETDGLNQYFAVISDAMLDIRIYMTLLALHSAAIALFALYIFARNFLIKYKVHAAVISVSLGLIFWFMPINKPYSTIFATVLILVLLIFSIIKSALSPVLRENPWTRLYFISLFIFMAAGMTKTFSGIYLYMPGLVSNLFMILSQCLLLSHSYSRAFSLVEETNSNLENIVEERTKTLQATHNAMKELIGNMSHDLKTPLSVMSVNLESLSSLAETKSDSKYQQHVRVAYQKNLDLQRLIQNLFEISRIETNRNIYSVKSESLLRLLARVKERYDDFLEDKDIAFEVTSGEDTGINIDPNKIWSVFDNIIYNSVRYTESGGIITIVAETFNDLVNVTITDTGCGIAEEHLPRIFERFYKVSAARNEKDGDSGLGLFIVRSIMEGCGGSVTAASEVGKGTAVVLTFKTNSLR
ncbi:MAG: sensor histidine kinase [Lachnospiraceae bacterium]|nr:sensor histidine kinase [Lachnospiraceae bacterium]